MAKVVAAFFCCELVEDLAAELPEGIDNMRKNMSLGRQTWA
jgi:hypothetical protein